VGDDQGGIKADDEGVIRGDDQGGIKADDEGVIRGDDEGVIRGDDEGVISGYDEGVISGYDEGVIKFEAEHLFEGLDARCFGEVACKLIAWREIIGRLGLVGQEAGRYGGAAYGNVSARVGPPSAVRGQRAMIISGSQTGGIDRIDLSHLCLVDRYDSRRNWVRSRGPIEPSSETMTHGAIYDLSPAIRFVLHAHSPVLWRARQTLRMPTSDPRVPYGTPEMAREVERLYRGTTLQATNILAMGGHEDGIIAFGQSVEQAGQTLVTWLARAYESCCRA
jgi:ribulose-5-phosphate 4-epimerase/fuculose-1-phosphate aldolase